MSGPSVAEIIHHQTLCTQTLTDTVTNMKTFQVQLMKLMKRPHTPDVNFVFTWTLRFLLNRFCHKTSGSKTTTQRCCCQLLD